MPLPRMTRSIGRKLRGTSNRDAAALTFPATAQVVGRPIQRQGATVRGFPHLLGVSFRSIRGRMHSVAFWCEAQFQGSPQHAGFPT